MKRLAPLLILALVVPVTTGCGTLRSMARMIGPTTTHHVCATASRVHDQSDVYVGLRLFAAAIGQPCDRAVELRIPPSIPAHGQALELRLGDEIAVDALLAPPATSAAPATLTAGTPPEREIYIVNTLRR